MPDVDTVSNWVDFYAQQLIRAKDWSILAAPFWNSLGEVTIAEEVSSRGARLYFVKNQAGGVSLPTPANPDNTRAVPSQSDSMWAVPQMSTISAVLDYGLMVDAGGANGPKKANAMFTIQEIISQTVDAFAQRQEFFACGNGSDAMAFAA